MVKILVHLNDLLFYLLQSYKTFSPFTIKKSITSKNLQKVDVYFFAENYVYFCSAFIMEIIL